ncbi:MFS transporter [Alicyclobacillus sacchari]|uniref:MFS transporter n=1 Tax=Alicyclobacillus sacchari TaxID=392010 RepID=UPI001FBA1997|nr:MFS transporter [Alicyclobacillus sacchari]
MESALAPEQRPNVLNVSLVILLGASFFGSLTTYMSQPFFVLYYHHALALPMAQAGLLVGLTPLSAALFGVIGGYVSDRIGIRRGYVLALAVTAVCFIGLASLRLYVLLLGVSVVMGLANATMRSGVQALINTRVPKSEAGRYQTYLYWLNNLGIVIGPTVATILFSAGKKPTVFYIAAGLLLLLAIVIWSVVRDAQAETPAATAPGEKPQEPPSKRPTFLDVMKCLGTDRALWWTFIALLCFIVVESQLTSTLGLYLASKFRHGTQYYGLLNTEIALIVLLCTPLVQRFAKKLPVTKVLPTGLVVLGLGLALSGFSTQPIGWFIGIFFYGIGEVLAITKVNEIMAGAAGRGNPATRFASLNSAMFLGMFIGYTLSTPLVSVLSSEVFYLGTFIIVICAMLAFLKAYHLLRETSVSESKNEATGAM